jgi:RNA polymerase sigma-70 factor (ECF subfamily)
VEERRPRYEATREQREQLATRFFAAAEQGDIEGLERLLAHDVVLRGDGGGKAPALARAVYGRARAARTLVNSMRARARFGITWRRGEVNGQPGALFFDRDGRLISVMSLDVAEGQIQGVSSVVNPDKLRHLGPLGDVNALLRERT